jgi:prepilin-type processing-associated H-X9-DG protein
VQKFGYNGMFRVLFQVFPDRLYRYGPLGAKDFPDGLSNTAAMAEWLHIGANQYARLRSVWQTPTPLWEAAQLDEFAAICASVPEDAKRYGWRGGSSLGASWLDPDAPSTMYNHVLPPGNPSCSNATHVQEGAYTANSLHPQGVNLLYADGHVSFVSKSIDLAAWRDIGSRIEYDLLVPLD